MIPQNDPIGCVPTFIQIYSYRNFRFKWVWNQTGTNHLKRVSQELFQKQTCIITKIFLRRSAAETPRDTTGIPDRVIMNYLVSITVDYTVKKCDSSTRKLIVFFLFFLECSQIKQNLFYSPLYIKVPSIHCTDYNFFVYLIPEMS